MRRRMMVSAIVVSLVLGAAQTGPSIQQDTSKSTGTEDTSEDSPKTLEPECNEHK